MKRFLLIFLTTFFWVFPTINLAFAAPTRITITVLSKDGKFIGTSMGGALVIIKNNRTGEILGKGLTKGSTGDTATIMKTPGTRGKVLSDEDSAKYTADLDISEPTYVEISAYGPMAQIQAGNQVSVTQWILPGKDITAGDGIMLVMPGFAVDVLSPRAHVKLTGAPQKVTITANITMMCGCPIEPDGLWDSKKFEIKALVEKDANEADVVDLRYAGEKSLFSGVYTASEPGAYEVTVYAFDDKNGNTGLDKSTFIIE